MPYTALFTLLTVIAASRAKAVPIDDSSFYDNQLSQLLTFNDLPSWQDSTLLNDAPTQIPQSLALDPCADPSVKPSANCPIPNSSAPASEEVEPLPIIKTYGGSIQDIPIEYPWNICGGSTPEPRAVPTCSSGNPQETVLEKSDDSGESVQLLRSFIYYPPPERGCPNNNAELWCCWQFTYEDTASQSPRGTGSNCINTNHMFRDITVDVFPNNYGYGVWPGMKYAPVYKSVDPHEPSVNYPQSPRT